MKKPIKFDHDSMQNAPIVGKTSSLLVYESSTCLCVDTTHGYEPFKHFNESADVEFKYELTKKASGKFKLVVYVPFSVADMISDTELYSLIYDYKKADGTLHLDQDIIGDSYGTVWAENHKMPLEDFLDVMLTDIGHPVALKWIAAAGPLFDALMVTGTNEIKNVHLIFDEGCPCCLRIAGEDTANTLVIGNKITTAVRCPECGISYIPSTIVDYDQISLF